MDNIEELKIRTMRPPIFCDQLIVDLEYDLFFRRDYDGTRYLKGLAREGAKKQLVQLKIEKQVYSNPS